MATLNNPIENQNIIDRFADYVVATANSGIVWGTNTVPFPEMPTANFGGSTGGRTISIAGSSIGADGTTITASTIYNTLVAQTNAYTSIRNMRAILFVLSSGASPWNTGTRPTPGVIFDSTQKSFLDASQLQSVGSPSNQGVASGQIIDDGNLENFFNELRTQYLSRVGNTVTIQIDVCHASCHSSCHNSRGRR